MSNEETNADQPDTRLAAIGHRLRGFWCRQERQILAIYLALQSLVQLVAMRFMPLPYNSRFSLYDGNTYFRTAQSLGLDRPVAQYTYHKRILNILLGRFLIPWNREWSFLVVGILAASLSAAYFAGPPRCSPSVRSD